MQSELMPMNIYEALESIKVLAPYVAPISGHSNGIDMVKALLAAIRERDPLDCFRLLAYMYHRDAEEIALELSEDEGQDLLTMLFEGFQVNPIPDLVLTGASLGLIKAA